MIKNSKDPLKDSFQIGDYYTLSTEIQFTVHCFDVYFLHRHQGSGHRTSVITV